jgi:hypothetical protein
MDLTSNINLISNTVIGNTVIEDDTRLAGTIVGPVTVVTGLAKFELSGTVIRNVTITKGSFV